MGDKPGSEPSGAKVSDEGAAKASMSKKPAPSGGFFSRAQKFPDEDYTRVSLGMFHIDSGFRRLVLNIVEMP
jgi:hypothetical protein